MKKEEEERELDLLQLCPFSQVSSSELVKGIEASQAGHISPTSSTETSFSVTFAEKKQHYICVCIAVTLIIFTFLTSLEECL